jgi:hypothetical protein
MDFHQFLTQALGAIPPGIRQGQALMNSLREVHSGLYHAVPWDLDPYYDDKLVPAFLDWLQDRWGRFHDLSKN